MGNLAKKAKKTLEEQRDALRPEKGIVERAEKTHWRSLLLALAAPFAGALIGSLATGNVQSSWYRQLKKPSFNPPGWIFGPVWTLLYALMGVASWLVWREGKKTGWLQWAASWGQSKDQQTKGALRLYGIHLIFNALWSVLFFGMHRVDLALGGIVILWSLIAGTIVRFSRIRPLAGLLLVPYQLWVTFAAVLNLRIWQLNRGK